MPSTPGIYFLFDRKELVYIGKTIHFPGRLYGHNSKSYNRMRFIACQPHRLDEYERRLIRFFKPRDNKVKYLKKEWRYKRPRRLDGVVRVRFTWPADVDHILKMHQRHLSMTLARRVSMQEACVDFIRTKEPQLSLTAA